MSCFEAQARRARDAGLVHGRRVAALCSCARWYHPIGYRATLSFLAEVAGPYQRHDHALVRAVDLLAASRAVWLAEFDAYAARRRAEKRTGRRTPGRDDRPPTMARGHWYETRPDLSRRAALHALKLWEAEHGSADPVVLALVRDCVATGGRLPVDQVPVGPLPRARSEWWPLRLVASAAGSANR